MVLTAATSAGKVRVYCFALVITGASFTVCATDVCVCCSLSGAQAVRADVIAIVIINAVVTLRVVRLTKALSFILYRLAKKLN